MLSHSFHCLSGHCWTFDTGRIRLLILSPWSCLCCKAVESWRGLHHGAGGALRQDEGRDGGGGDRVEVWLPHRDILPAAGEEDEGPARTPHTAERETNTGHTQGTELQWLSHIPCCLLRCIYQFYEEILVNVFTYWPNICIFKGGWYYDWKLLKKNIIFIKHLVVSQEVWVLTQTAELLQKNAHHSRDIPRRNRAPGRRDPRAGRESGYHSQTPRTATRRTRRISSCRRCPASGTRPRVRGMRCPRAPLWIRTWLNRAGSPVLHSWPSSCLLLLMTHVCYIGVKICVDVIIYNMKKILYVR